MLYYHQFNDRKIDGIYDLEPLMPKYGIPENLAGKHVLDVGCASGYLSRHCLRSKAAHVTSVDINTDAWRQISSFPGEDWDWRLRIVSSDFYELRYDNEFDLVICGSLLMHALYPMELLNLIRRALKPGGLMILATSGIESPEPYIRVEPHLGREHVPKVEVEIRSSNQSLWWVSPRAMFNMLTSLGYQDSKHFSSFILQSTEYGVSIGHNFSTLHHVFHAVK